VDSTLFKYIIRHSGRQQIILCIMVGLAMPFLYLSLDLPKQIINDAIGGSGEFPIELGLFGLSVELGQINYLLVLSFIFLGLVLINGAFKYSINIYSGVIGERMLRRLRFDLFTRVLRFPIPQFRKVGQGEIVSMVVAETDPLGGFIGNSIRVPVFQGGTLLTILVFMFVQDWKLGLAAIALYPLQSWLIRRLQRRLNQLRREIIVEKRRVSERIGEVVNSIQEVHIHGTSRYERAQFSAQMFKVYLLRLDIFRRKFLIKFLNNFIAQVTPFFFYSIGGVLVIQGDLSFGAMVAILAAYKDLNAPWKELLDYYQQKEDARVKYELLYSTFQPHGMIDESLQVEAPTSLPHLKGELQTAGLDLREDPDSDSMGGLSIKTNLDSSVALVGPAGSGTRRLAALIGRLTEPLAGWIRVGDHDLNRLPELVTGRRVGYVGDDPKLRSGTVWDNLVYGLQQTPHPGDDPDPVSGDAHRHHEVNEARLTGNSTEDPNVNWVNYDAAGVSDAETLAERAIEALKIVELENDIYGFGLQGRIDPEERPEVAERIMAARRALHVQLEQPEFEGLVETFDQSRYNTNMTVAENILFGTPQTDEFHLDNLANNPYMRKVLHETGLMDDFLQMGHQLAALMVEIFADVAPDSELFEQFSFIRAEDLPEFRSLLNRISDRSIAELDAEDKSRLLSLPFQLAPARHRLGLIDENTQARLLTARAAFASGFGDGPPPIAFFDVDKFNPQGSIQDNILFGRQAYGRAKSSREIGILVRRVVEQLNLGSTILEIGMQSSVGISGGRLSSTQRQKLAIARNLIKQPDLLVLNQVASPLDVETGERIVTKLAESNQVDSLLCVFRDLSEASNFVKVILLDSGQLAAIGSYEEVAAQHA
jgi:ABC-type multidrug transport system fused ATPase/permease subunit